MKPKFAIICIWFSKLLHLKTNRNIFPGFFVINSIMTTATSPLSRQPTVTDYSSPTQFRFGINQLPKVEFFTIGLLDQLRATRRIGKLEQLELLI